MPANAPADERHHLGRERRVREVMDAHVDRHVGQRAEQAAREHDLLAADAIGELAEEDEQRRAERERDGDERVGEAPVEVERLLKKSQRVELARVPDDALAGRRAEEREQHVLAGCAGCRSSP